MATPTQPPTVASGSNDPLDLIVAEYLRARGFSKTLMELDNESKEYRHTLGGPRGEESGSSVSRPSKHLDAAYQQSYSTFKAWTLAAIDIFRYELNFLSFPVFAVW